MERSVDRASGSELLAWKTGLDLIERPGVVPERVCVLLEIGDGGLDRLVVVLDRVPLAVARRAVVLDLDVDDLGGVLAPARDREGLRELQGGDPGRKLARPDPTGPKY